MSSTFYWNLLEHFGGMSSYDAESIAVLNSMRIRESRPYNIFLGSLTLTSRYEFYFDVYLQGKYAWKIQELHKRYGPIVRINPEELHVDDAGLYDKIYVGNRRTDKWHWSAKMFGYVRLFL